MSENDSSRSGGCPLFGGTSERRPPANRAPKRPVRLPPGPRGLPLVGSLPRYLANAPAFLNDNRRYGPISHYRFGRTHLFQLNEPADIHRILVLEEGGGVKAGAVIRIKSVVGEGLLVLEGDRHRRHRRLIQPAFSKSQIDVYAAQVEPVVSRAMERWRPGQPIDATEFCDRSALQIFTRAIFRASPRDARRLREASEVLLAATSRSIAPWAPWLDRILWWRGQRIQRAQQTVDGFIHRLIEERRRRPSEDFVSALLSTQTGEAEEPALTDDEIRDELMTHLFAGTETVATATAWALLLLSQNREADEALLRELASAGPDDRGQFHYERVAPLPYLDGVVKEALRLYPPIPAIPRRTTADYEVAGYTVPAGSIVGVSPYAVHHDPRFYPDPFRFDPLRWTPECEASRPKPTFIPFGAGPRACIGAGFALAEMKMILTSVLWRWRFETAVRGNPEFKPTFTLRPKSPIRLIVKRREHSGGAQPSRPAQQASCGNTPVNGGNI